MSNRSATYNLYLNSNVRAALQETENQAAKLDGTMWQLQKTLSAFGVGLGAHYIKDFISDAVSGAADYEVAMMRIKNVSSNATEGLKNQHFILKEIGDLKIPLQEAADAYGMFLLKIQNAGLQSNQVNRLYEEILTIGKVTGLPSSGMDKAVYDIGVLLGEGTLEARHIRALASVFPQIMPFLARSLDTTYDLSKILKTEPNSGEEMTEMQKLMKTVSSGKLTKSGFKSDILLGVIEDYYSELTKKGGLQEATSTLRSSITDIQNDWLNFKNNLTLTELKPELVELFERLKDAIKWLADHQSEIIKWTETVAEVVKLFIEWRLAIFALEAPFRIFSFFTGEYWKLNSALGLYKNLLSQTTLGQNAQTAATEAQTAAYEAQTFAIYEEVAAFERMNKVQFEQFFNAWAGGNYYATKSANQLASGQKLLGAGIAEEEIVDAEILSVETLGAVTAAGMSLTSIIGITAASIAALGAVAAITKDQIDKHNKSVEERNEVYERNEFYNSIVGGAIRDLHLEQMKSGASGTNEDFFLKRATEFGGTEFEAILEARRGKNPIFQNHIKELFSDFLNEKESVNMLNLLTSSDLNQPENRENFNKLLRFFEIEEEKFTNEDKGKTDTKTHVKDITNTATKLKGNGVYNITIHIDELNGINKPTFSGKGMADVPDIEKKIATTVTKMLTDAVNDSQQIANRH